MKQAAVLLLLMNLLACVSEKEEGTVVSDGTIFSLANNPASFTYFKNSSDTLSTDPTSDHGFFVRVRLNPRATSAMDDSVSTLDVSSFPDESMVVKEVYLSKGGPLSSLVVMYKMKEGANNNYGWLWGEYQSDGTPIYSVANKGNRCVGCHLQTANADLVRTFSLH